MSGTEQDTFPVGEITSTFVPPPVSPPDIIKAGNAAIELNENWKYMIWIMYVHSYKSHLLVSEFLLLLSLVWLLLLVVFLCHLLEL